MLIFYYLDNHFGFRTMGNKHPCHNYVKVKDSILQCCKCETRIPGLKYAARHCNSAKDIDVIFFYQFATEDIVVSSAFSDVEMDIQVIESGTPMIQMLECHKDQGKYFCCRCVSNNPVFVRFALALKSKAAIVNDDMSRYWIGQPK